MSLFKVLMTLGAAKVQKKEQELEEKNPVPFIQKAIDDLQKELSQAVTDLGHTRPAAAHAKQEYETAVGQINEFLDAAERLSKKEDAHSKELAEKSFTQALTIQGTLPSLEQNMEAQTQAARELEKQVGKLEKEIEAWKGKLAALIARDTAASARKKISEERARTDFSGTHTMLDRMQKAIEAKEDEAQTLEHIAEQREGGDATHLGAEIHEALGDTPASGGDIAARIAALRKGMPS